MAVVTESSINHIDFEYWDTLSCNDSINNLAKSINANFLFSPYFFTTIYDVNYSNGSLFKLLFTICDFFKKD